MTSEEQGDLVAKIADAIRDVIIVEAARRGQRINRIVAAALSIGAGANVSRVTVGEEQTSTSLAQCLVTYYGRDGARAALDRALSIDERAKAREVATGAAVLAGRAGA